MGRSVADILAPKRIVEVISRTTTALTSLSQLFGWDIGGSNRQSYGGRHFFYDVFNNSRAVATGSVPGTASRRRTPQKVGEVFGVFPRAVEHIILNDEQIFNRRKMGGPTSDLDSMGEDYILRQSTFLGQIFASIIEFQTAAMLRGSYTFSQVDDTLFHAFTGGSREIEFQIPANNKNQLAAIIAASWATTTTDIPGHCMAVNAKSMELTGLPIKHAILNSFTWQYVVKNLVVQGEGGTANLVFETLTQDENGNFTARLRSMPWLTWHIFDHGLNVGTTEAGTYTKLIANDQVTFIPEPSPFWATYYDGSEIVTEGPGGPRGEQMGFYSYAHGIDDPSGYKMLMGHNGIPSLKIPEAIFNADVTP